MLNQCQILSDWLRFIWKCAGLVTFESEPRCWNQIISDHLVSAQISLLIITQVMMSRPMMLVLKTFFYILLLHLFFFFTVFHIQTPGYSNAIIFQKRTTTESASSWSPWMAHVFQVRLKPGCCRAWWWISSRPAAAPLPGRCASWVWQSGTANGHQRWTSVTACPRFTHHLHFRGPADCWVRDYLWVCIKLTKPRQLEISWISLFSEKWPNTNKPDALLRWTLWILTLSNDVRNI